MPQAGDPVPGQPGSFYNQFGGVYQVGLPAVTAANPNAGQAAAALGAPTPPQPTPTPATNAPSPAPSAVTQQPSTTAASTAKPGDPRYFVQPGSGNVLQLTQGGQNKSVDAGDFNQVDQLVKQGWTPIDPTSGQPMKMTQYQGGTMFQRTDGSWQPLNVMLGGQWQPQDTATMPAFNQFLQSTGGGQTAGPSGLIQNLENPNLPLIPQENLGPTPQIPGSLSPETMAQTSDLTRQVSDAIGGTYWQAQRDMPQAQAAQTQQSAVPQVQGTQMPLSDQVKAMLSGTLGYNPDILARMKANATDAVGAMGQSQLAQANRVAEQAGLGGGGANAAQAQDIARQTGAANTQAQNAIDIQNAGVAQQNFNTGVGMQQNVLQDNFQMANQMALENAQKLFQNIQQNTANMQQTNLANAQAGQALNQQGAATKSGFEASQGNLANSANIQQAMNALSGNTQNEINRQLNQAQLNRQQAVTNLGSQQNQWQTANTLLGGFAPVNQFNPQQTFSPIGGTMQNLGAGLLNQGQKNILGAQQ